MIWLPHRGADRHDLCGNFEKIRRSDGPLDIKTYVGGLAIVTASTTGRGTMTSTAYTLTDHLGSGSIGLSANSMPSGSIL